jgi:hypothetical protein
MRMFISYPLDILSQASTTLTKETCQHRIPMPLLAQDKRTGLKDEH